jgi:hypothetical protein
MASVKIIIISEEQIVSLLLQKEAIVNNSLIKNILASSPN